MKFSLTNHFKEKFSEAIKNNDKIFISESLYDVRPADITELLYEFNSIHSKYVLDSIDLSTASKIISELDQDTRVNFLKVFSAGEIAKYLEKIDSDDGADILSDLDLDLRNKVITSIQDDDRSSNLKDLMRYDDDVAGGLMAKELVRCNLNWNIIQCIDQIRKQAEEVSKVYSVYVTDNYGKLIGKVSLKKIIIANDKTKIKEIYDDFVVSVNVYTNKEEIVLIMQKYDLEALPVVNKRGKLVGRITIDDVVDVITESAEEERQLMSGISSDVEEDDSIWKLSNARLPWLLIGILGGFLGAIFLGSFENTFISDNKLFISLSFFIPLIMATGGNVGIQSSSIVIQSLSNPSAFQDSVISRLFKVSIIAVLNGLVLALIVYFGIKFLISENPKIPYIVSLSLFTVVIISSLMGTLTPILLDKLGFNPALASGPFITTTNDILGLAIYFMVAIFLNSI